MKNTTKVKAIIVIGLSFISYWFFFREVYSKFIEERTSVSKRNVDGIISPMATTFCVEPNLKQNVLDKYNITHMTISQDPHYFAGLFDEASYKLNEDFQILVSSANDLFNQEMKPIALGENQMTRYGYEFKFIVEELPTWYNGLCYLVLFDESTQINTLYSDVPLKIKSLNQELKQMSIYITSKKNYYGLISGEWNNYRPVKTTLNFGSGHKLVMIDLHETVEKYLCDESKEQSFWNCFMDELQNIHEKEEVACVMKAMEGFYKNKSLKMCQTAAEEWKMIHFLGNNFEKFENCNNNVCQVSFYGAYVEHINWRDRQDQPISVAIKSTSFTKTIKEEYYVYDFEGLFGNVGGTLGLFLGFSIFGLFCDLMNYFFPE